jgi:hypothetical protein
MNLGIEALEQAFGRFVAAALGQSHRANGLQLDPKTAATLLILREFMHRLQFRSISILLPSRWTTHWRWRSRQRCSLAGLVTTAGLSGRWPAIVVFPQT